MFHLSGYNLDIDSFDSNYKLLNELNIDVGDIYAKEDEEMRDYIPNIFIQIFKCPKECTLDEAKHYTLLNIQGMMTIETQEYGYSEYTIEGFNVYNMTLGGHNIEKILKDKSKGIYTHITIQRIKE